jgi:hypothetical protein
MSLRSLKLFIFTLITTLLLISCGGESAPAPSGVTAVVGESSAKITWNMESGVEYWLFFGPSSLVPADTASMKGWIGLPGGGTLLNVSSPYVVTGLVNGVNYSFSFNARTNGGPGGSGTTPVITAPRIAGSSWQAGAAVTTNDLRSLVFGGVPAVAATSTTAEVVSTLTYVAAGSGGAMYSSLDGSSWTALNYTSNTNQLNGAAYLAGVYTLVGDKGTILTTSDLSAWTARTAPAGISGKNLYAVANNGAALSVAVGEGGSIIYSADGGATWTAAAFSGTAPTKDLFAVTYSPLNVGTNTAGTWVAVGAGGSMVQSADGLTWATVDLSSISTVTLRGVAFAASASDTGVVSQAFVVVGDAGTVLGSPDGVTWTAQNALNGGYALNAVNSAVTVGSAYPSTVSLFVAVGQGGGIFTSTNGLTWTAISPTPASTKNLYAVTRNTTLGSLGYAAVGATGANLTSK